MTTENMQKFIDMNSKEKIVEGERLNKDGKRVTNLLGVSGGVIRYTFKSGVSITLDREDLLSNLSYEPVWDL